VASECAKVAEDERKNIKRQRVVLTPRPAHCPGPAAIIAATASSIAAEAVAAAEHAVRMAVECGLALQCEIAVGVWRAPLPPP